MTDQDERILQEFSKKDQTIARQMNEASRRDYQRIFKELPTTEHSRGLGHYVLDQNNICVPVGLGTWAIWFEREHQKGQAGRWRVSLDEWDDPKYGHVRVSTVFIGLDHSFGLSRSRKLFETMVFWGWSDETSSSDQWMDRYSTWLQAQAGHKHAVGLTRMFLAGEIAKEQYHE